MVFTIFLKSILVPIVLASASLFFIKHVKNLWPGLVSTWLVSVLWISGVPDFPPKQATDWFFLFLIGLLSASYFPITKLFKRLIQASFALLILGLISLPLFKYSFNLPFLTEFVMFGLLIGLLNFLDYKPLSANSAQPHLEIERLFFLSFAIGFGGVATVITGSLLIGFLMISLGAFVFVVAMSRCFKLTRPSDVSCFEHDYINFALMSVMLIFIARQFADLYLLSTLMLLAVLFVSLPPFKRVQKIAIVAVLLLGALGNVVYYDLIAESATDAYY